MTDPFEGDCQVSTARPPHYLHPVRCTKKATMIRAGVHCCKTHANQADRWDRDGRMRRMISMYWHVGGR